MSPKAHLTFASVLLRLVHRTPGSTVVALADQLDVPNTSLTTWLKVRVDGGNGHYPRPPVMARILQHASLTSEERTALLREYFAVQDLRVLGLATTSQDSILPTDASIELTTRAYYETHRRLAPSFGLTDLLPTWDGLAQDDRHLMTAAFRDLVSKGFILLP